MRQERKREGEEERERDGDEQLRSKSSWKKEHTQGGACGEDLLCRERNHFIGLYFKLLYT